MSADVTEAIRLFGEVLADRADAAGADVLIRAHADPKHADAGRRFRVSHARAGVEVAGTGNDLPAAVDDYIANAVEASSGVPRALREGRGRKPE